MPVKVEWVRHGVAAGEALAAAVAAAKGGDPLAPITVVVPSNHVGVGARRRLARSGAGLAGAPGRGIAAVTFLTPYRLAELLGVRRLAATGRRPVSTPVVAAAVRAALAARPGVFAAVAEHPATEQALVDAYRELRDCSPAALDALAARSPRAADVVALHRAVRTALAPTWYDEEDLTVAAVEALEADDPFAATLGSVVVHLPQGLTRHAGALLAAVADRCDTTVLAGTTGHLRADAEVRTALARMDAAGEPPAEAAAAGAQPLVEASRTRFVTCSDADDEVRAAVRVVVDAARAGTPLDRVAVFHASPEPYARLVHEHLAAAGVAASGASVVPLSARVAGRALVELLALPEGGFARDDVLAWLSAAPLRDSDGRLLPVAAWDRISRDAGVVAGRADWSERLTRWADERDAEAAELEAGADSDREPTWAERSRTEAARARALRDHVVALVDDLAEQAASPRPWSEHADWARSWLGAALGGPGQRGGWPEAERRAAERVEQALARLAVLDGVEGPVGLDVFDRTLALELDADLGRVGRLGEGVLVGGIGMGVGLDLDLVVVVGLVEGSFPAAVRDDSLLPDAERAVTGGELALRADRTHRQHRELLATLAGARRHVLALPRGDLRTSGERVPSRFALDLAGRLDGARWSSGDLLGAERRPWVAHVPSFDAGLRAAAFPATVQEHRLRALLAADPRPGDLDVLERSVDAGLAAAAGVVAARRSDRFTRFDGHVTGVAVPSPADRLVSPTSLERWAACPFHYLVTDILRARPVERPEEQLELTPADRGLAVHAVLERFLDEVLVRAEGPPPPEQAWTTVDHARIDDLAAEVCAEVERRGRAGRPLFWVRDRRRIAADLHHILDLDSARRRQRRTRPVAAELAFGMRDATVEAAPFRLLDGRVVRFRGSADRVDRAEGGALHVVDYKTGGTRGAEKLSTEDPDLRGTKLQLPVYALAARLQQGAPDASVHAGYWFVSAKGRFAEHGYEVTGEVLASVGATLATIVDGIEAGVFPSRPTAHATNPWVECPSCEPDGLGVVELRRAFDRKRHDPALSAYADLAEPPDPDDDEEVAARAR